MKYCTWEERRRMCQGNEYVIATSWLDAMWTYVKWNWRIFKRHNLPIIQCYRLRKAAEAYAKAAVREEPNEELMGVRSHSIRTARILAEYE